MRILYFSWIKDKVGKSVEEVDITAEVKNIQQLINFLTEKSNSHKEAFSDLEAIRYSINMQTADIKDEIKDDDEVAFFPPMTGG